LKTAWRTAKKMSGVTARWHDLRHTVVKRLLESDQMLMVANILGGSPSTMVRMAQRYGHISTDARRAAMESMNAPGPALTDRKFENVEALADKSGAVH
jgi:integrase